MNKRPKVVVMGGGSGISVVLKGLKHLPIDLTAIVSVADDGGSSGVLRREFNSQPPGDLRSVLIALSDVEPIIEEVFQYRFTKGRGITGHPLGNLLILAMNEITGNTEKAMYKLKKLFNIKANILPSCLENVVLYGEMEDGSIVKGESKIPNREKKIKRVFFKRQILAPKRNIDELLNADLIIFGIGSLFTSVIPNLLPVGVCQAINKSSAKKVYICNAMEQPGETHGFSAYEHIMEIHKVLEGKIDEVIVDTQEISQDILQKYKNFGSGVVVVEKDKIENLGVKIVDTKVLEIDKEGYVRHHPHKLAATIYSLIDKWGDFYV